MKSNQSEDNHFCRSNSRPEPVIYEIMVQGELSEVWSKWFEGMTLTYTQESENGVEYTLISGPVIDQPALHGLLTKIRDLNLTLISVRRFVPGTTKDEEIAIKPEL